jgi:uncharacterized cupredoxin-like copper-binding protein
MKRFTIAAMAAALMLAMAACSSDSSTSSAAASTSTSPDSSSGSTIDATIKDFSISLDPSTATAGEVTFDITNEGPSTHEFVVIQTDDAPDDLPVENDEVTEDGLTVIGEQEDIPASSTASLTLTLDAGQYVVFCNITGHYSQGMYSGLTVS